MFERTKNNLRKAGEAAERLATASIRVFKKLYTFQIVALLIIAGSIGITFTLYAAPNQAFVYQGRLTDTNYIPVANGTYFIKLRIYSDSAGTTCVWSTGSVTNASLATITSNCTEALTTSAVQTTVAHGSFAVHLGDTTITGGKMPDISNLNFKTTTYYLGVTVCGTGADAATACAASPSEMTPLLAIRGSVAGASIINTLQANTFNQVPSTYTTVTGSEINNTDTTVTSFTVGSTSGYPSSGTLLIDNEVMTYTGTTSATFTGVTRARHSTVAAAHLGSTVKTYLFSGASSATTRPMFFITSDGNTFINSSGAPIQSQVGLQISGATAYGFGNDVVGNNYFNIRAGSLDDFSVPTFYRIRVDSNPIGIFSLHGLNSRAVTLTTAFATDDYSALTVTPSTTTLAGATSLTAMNAILFNKPTIDPGTLTVGDASTLAIAGPPLRSGAAGTISNSYGLKINTAAVGTTTSSYGLAVAAPTGATNNYSAIFTGGNVGIGTTAPITQLHVKGSVPTGALTSVKHTQGAGNSVDSVYVQGRYAYTVNSSGNFLNVIDISTEGRSFTGTGTFESAGTTVTGAGTAFTTQLAVGDTITASSQTRTITAIGGPVSLTTDTAFSPALPASTSFTYKQGRIVGSTPTSTDQPVDVFVQGKYAYVVGYPALGNGVINVVDISNPASPTVVGGNATGGSGTSAIYVQGKYAYVINSGNHTLQIFDISRPVSPTSMNGTGTVTGLNTNPNSIYVQGRYAYITNSATNTFVIMDVSNPATPSIVGSAVSTIADPRGIAVQGRYAYVVGRPNGNSGIGALQIFDISNPSLVPAALNGGSGTAMAAGTIGIAVSGRYAYISNFAANNVLIYDISTPSSPLLIGTLSTDPGPWRLFANSRFLFVGTWTGATLQTFDLGGAYIQQTEVGGLEIASGNVRNDFTVNNNLDVRGGINIGLGGLSSGGPLAISGLDTAATTPALTLWNSLGTNLLYMGNDGKLGLGTTTPTYSLSLNGSSLRMISMAPAAAGAGLSLTLRGSNGGTDVNNRAGGSLILSSGQSRGTALSKVQIQVPQAGTVSNATLNSANPMFEFVNGHMAALALGATPTASCNGNVAAFAAGSNDTAGRITFPVGGGSTCKLTFARSFASTPMCTAIYEGVLSSTAQLNGGSGIISSAGTTVTGLFGTSFTTELASGDSIMAEGQTRIVDAVSTNSSLTTTTAFSPALAPGGGPFTIQSKSSVKFTFSPTPSAGEKFSYYCIGQGSQ